MFSSSRRVIFLSNREFSRVLHGSARMVYEEKHPSPGHINLKLPTVTGMYRSMLVRQEDGT